MTAKPLDLDELNRENLALHRMLAATQLDAATAWRRYENCNQSRQRDSELIANLNAKFQEQSSPSRNPPLSTLFFSELHTAILPDSSRVAQALRELASLFPGCTALISHMTDNEVLARAAELEKMTGAPELRPRLQDVAKAYLKYLSFRKDYVLWLNSQPNDFFKPTSREHVLQLYDQTCNPLGNIFSIEIPLAVCEIAGLSKDVISEVVAECQSMLHRVEQHELQKNNEEGARLLQRASQELAVIAEIGYKGFCEKQVLD